jgi:uncharacterized membrane protein YidH (DUF202 family)
MSNDGGLQHERTALAWERTAISTIVAGVLLARYAAASLHVAFAAFGLAQVVFGAGLLIWTGRRYNDLHGPLQAGVNPAHPRATRLVGIATVGFIGAAVLLAVVITLDR